MQPLTKIRRLRPENSDFGESETVGDQLESSIKKWIISFYDWLEAAIIALIVIVLVFIFVFRNVGVDGPSMNPTLVSGDRLILLTLINTPSRGDIVVIDRYTQAPLIKRVIAVGGDTISIGEDSGKVMLNGKILNENYAVGKTIVRDFGTGTKTVPKGYLVVMGDNREVSKDSRSAEIGFVNVKAVIGKAIFRFFPAKRIGFVS